MADYSDMNLVLYVASYGDDAGAAKQDYQSLKQLSDAAVVASVVLTRDQGGTVDVEEHGGGQIKRGATIGGVAGLAVGLFAPPLLLATAAGIGLGAAAGSIARRHQENQIASAVDEDDWLPAGSSAIVAVIDNKYLDNVDAALANATKKVNKAIDKGDYDDVVKALNEGGQKVVEAVGAEA